MNDIGERLLLMGYTSRGTNNYYLIPAASFNGRNYYITIEVGMYHLNFMVSVEAPITLMVDPVRIPLTENNMAKLAELSLTNNDTRFQQLLDVLTGD